MGRASAAMDSPSAVTSLLRHGPFVRFLYVRVAASVALQVQALAVGWQMYVLTGSSFNLGLVGLVQFIPTLSLFLVTGQAADRFDRRIVAASAQTVEALAIAALAVTTASGLLTPGLL